MLGWLNGEISGATRFTSMRFRPQMMHEHPTNLASPIDSFLVIGSELLITVDHAIFVRRSVQLRCCGFIAFSDTHLCDDLELAIGPRNSQWIIIRHCGENRRVQV
jgi:hypothetical protein